ncbi:MAG: polyphosphate kinase 1 [Bacteroidales bacterium]|nr:polyphosphate kinase 1 [Bacteroidales bacterium]
MDKINREISWLQFNERVLQEGLDERNPLLERIRFLGIFSNNRDEFFKVRVATIRRLIVFNEKENPEQALHYRNVLKDILKTVENQERAYTRAFVQIRQELRKNSIFLLNEKEIDAEQGQFIKDFFLNKVRQVIYPIMLDKFNGGANLKDRAIYLAVVMTDTNAIEKERHALIEIPSEELSRFVILPSKEGQHFLMFLEDAIRYNLSEIFSIFGYNSFNGYIIKFTRDAELDIDNDVSKSFLEIMSESVQKRKNAPAIRFVYDKEIPEKLLTKVLKKLQIKTGNDHLRGGGRYHNFKDLMSFPELSEGLTYAPQPPIPHPDLPYNKSFFTILSKRDILLHFPYQPFQHIIDLLREASIDPQVRSIKMTFYRAAKKSRVMNALINAARNGKHVTVFIELQARFDEEANIYWAQKLQHEGVKVLATIPGTKVHAKTILIRRKELGKDKYYSLIGTGNFNESTAAIYSDLTLITDNQAIGLDIKQFFYQIESKYLMVKYDRIKVAPFGFRDFFIKMINREIRYQKKGREAWIILKSNSLVDNEIVDKLYEAAKEGIKIKLLIRGINVVKSGINGVSENIESRSIVGRYLEHSRIFIFANGGRPEYYIGSADLMPRNIDHRFEIVTPVTDKNIKKQLKTIIDIQWQDQVKSRSLDCDMINTYLFDKKQKNNTDTHIVTYNYFKNLEKK